MCRDFPQNYIAIPLALATRNLFHNFLSLRSLLHFKINILFIFRSGNVFICLKILYRKQLAAIYFNLHIEGVTLPLGQKYTYTF